MAGYGRAMLVSSSEKNTLVLHSTFKPLATALVLSYLSCYSIERFPPNSRFCYIFQRHPTLWVFYVLLDCLGVFYFFSGQLAFSVRLCLVS